MKRLNIIGSAFTLIIVILIALTFGGARHISKTANDKDDSLLIRQKLFISSSSQMYDEDDEKEEIGDTLHLKTQASIDNISDGYTDQQSYNPGDTVKVFVNAVSVINNAKIHLYNINFSRKDSLIANLAPQAMSANQPWLNFGYSCTFRYVIPATLKSGMYHFGNRIFFIVKSRHKSADITIVYPTNTEAAYNNIGGKSLYDFNSGSQRARVVTFRRPLSTYILNEIQYHSRPFIKWLNSKAYSVQYIADQDMDDYNEIAHSKLLVVIGHSEYWSRKGRKNFDKFVDLGNDAAVFSGNTMWWQVRYSNDKSQLICYKDSASDPEANPALKTIEWPRASLNYPTLTSIGADFPHGAYGMYQVYHGNYGYMIMLPNSPLLQGTGLGYHNILTCQSYEYDGALFSGFNGSGDPIIDSTTLNFCKTELIGYDYGEQTSNIYPAPTGYGTFIVFKKNPTSGIIVNTGFNTFTGKTPSYGSGGIAGPDSAKIEKIVLNIFNKLLNKQNVFANPVPGCSDIYSGITTSNGDNKMCSVYPNPANDLLTVTFKDNFDQKDLLFDLFDIGGRKILSAHLDPFKTNSVNVSSVAPGTYFYVISKAGSKTVKTEKIIIAH